MTPFVLVIIFGSSSGWSHPPLAIDMPSRAVCERTRQMFLGSDDPELRRFHAWVGVQIAECIDRSGKP